MKLLLDVMGGDYGPLANLEGALQALPQLEGSLGLIGDEAVIQKTLRNRRLKPLALALEQGASRPGCQVSLIPAHETIDMADSIRAIRQKPQASINVGCRLASEGYEKGQPTAFISAGHSGALMASALLNMGRLPGVERPAIAVTLPTLSPEGCVVLDVGANVDCKPEHLRDFAIMGALYRQGTSVSNVTLSRLPRFALLSNGEERSKGNELTRASALLIEKHPAFQTSADALNDTQAGTFLGYCEGKEIFQGQVDVVVTDGFTGNVMLKSVEGLGKAIITLLKREAKAHPFSMIGFFLAGRVLKNLKKKLDYAEYGAAPLLGVAGYAFVCHGRSKAKAIKNALLATQTSLKSGFVERLAKTLPQETAQPAPEKDQNRSEPK